MTWCALCRNPQLFRCMRFRFDTGGQGDLVRSLCAF